MDLDLFYIFVNYEFQMVVMDCESVLNLWICCFFLEV